MTTAISVCDVECQEDIAILTPTVNLGELVYEDFEAIVSSTLEMLDNGDVGHVVIDFGRTDYFGSHAITLMQSLGRKVRSLGGRLALTGLSAHENEILEAMALGRFWPVYSSREEATEAVSGTDASLKYQTAEDRDLEHRIINFMQDRHVPDCQCVKVKAANGTVVVRGQVSSAHSKWLCMECCRHVAGVIKLVDKVRITESSCS